MSQIETGIANKTESKSLYPQRAFEYVDQAVDEIQKIVSGEEPKIELNAAETENLLAFEKSLSIELEKIYKISINSTTLYLDYFATEAGRKALWEKTGLESNSTDLAWIRDFIFSNSEHIAKLSSTTRKELSGEALAFKDQSLLDQLEKSANLEGNISVQDISIPQKIEVLINPAKAKEKIGGLRDLKQLFKEKYKDVDRVTDDSSVLRLAKKEILDIYRRRVNIMIMNVFPYALLVDQKRKTVGEDNLSKDEKVFLEFFKGLSSPEKNMSRLDKLIYGASSGYDDEGWKMQTPESLLPYAERIAELGEDAEIHKEEMIHAKGIDPEKIQREKIDVETRSSFGEEILASYDLLSSEPGKTYNSERNGKAKDGKWQIVNLPDKKTFGVYEKKGVVSGPEQVSYDVADTIETLGHEIEGHVLQSENKKLVDLEYFQKFGRDSRAVILSEGGAMFVQDVISRGAFGYPTIPHPHYIRAMQKKLEGGNYLDCIKSFYDSRMTAIKKKREEGKFNDSAFRAKIRASLKAAINRTTRLFGTGASLSSREKHLTHSKDTAYLEQYILTEKLKSVGLENLLFLGAGSLQDIITLLKLNKLNISKIQTPKYQALKIWEKEKNKYLL